MKLFMNKLLLAGIMLFSAGQAMAQRPIDMFAFGGSIGGYRLSKGASSRPLRTGFSQNKRIYLREDFGSAKLSGRVLSGTGRISCSSKSCNLTGVPSGIGPTVKIELRVTNVGSGDASGGVWYN